MEQSNRRGLQRPPGQSWRGSEAYGVEFEGAYDLTSDFELFLTLGYLETEIKSAASASQGALVGNEFGKAPNWSGAFGGVYRNAHGLFATASVSFEDESFDDVENQRTVTIENPRTQAYGVYTFPATIDARTVVDAKVGWEWEKVALYVFADNLLDEDYIDNVSFRNSSKVAPFTPPFSGTYPYDATFVQVGDPRTVGVELRLNY